jgi:hypothetical protein
MNKCSKKSPPERDFIGYYATLDGGGRFRLPDGGKIKVKLNTDWCQSCHLTRKRRVIIALSASKYDARLRVSPE